MKYVRSSCGASAWVVRREPGAKAPLENVCGSWG
jgi:hypothetical protein